MIEMTMENIEKLRKLGAAKIESDKSGVLDIEFYPEQISYVGDKNLQNMNDIGNYKSQVDEFEKELDNISNNIRL